MFGDVLAEIVDVPQKGLVFTAPRSHAHINLQYLRRLVQNAMTTVI